MTDSRNQHTSPTDPGGDGVRITPVPTAFGPGTMALLLLVLLAVGATVGYLLTRTVPTPPNSGAPARGQDSDATADTPATTGSNTREVNALNPPSLPPRHPAWTPPRAADMRSGDDNDLATYVSPDDPEPTMAEVIEALRESGEHGGLAAFNPPGTSPPMIGLAVPEDFDLPEGYVRHHQVTDEGEPIEAILMFSPDFVFRDADGQPIPIPEDRIVPAELAPTGLPIRPITLPPPPE